VETSFPSQLPASGEVKISSVGMLGMYRTPLRLLVVAAPSQCAPGISSTVKSVPFALL
jgi:hypothetical protein